MNKKFLLLGFLIFVISLVLAFETYQTSLGAIGAGSRYQGQFVIGPHNSTSVSVPLNQTDVFAFTYVSTSAVDFYFMNASAFPMLGNVSNATSSIYPRAAALEGKGMLEISLNGTEGSYPYSQAYAPNSKAPTYQASGNATVLASGTYYVVFQNPLNATTGVSLQSFITPVSALSLTSTKFAALSAATFVLFAIGIGLMIFGFVKKGPAPKVSASEEEERKRAYANVKASPKKSAVSEADRAEIERLYGRARRPKARKAGKRKEKKVKRKRG